MNGRVAYHESDGAFAIETQPHIALRLKRVFGKADKNDHGVQWISSSIENCRDLLWFLDRYPMDLEPGVGDRLREGAKAHEAQQQIVDRILSGAYKPSLAPLAVPLRHYQELAASIALDLGSLLLADEVGLGKTAVAIGTIADVRARPALVVTLTHLPKQWQTEFTRFAPGLRVHILQGTTPYDLTKPRCKKHRIVHDMFAPGGGACSRCGASRDDVYHGRLGTMPDVVLTSYSKLQGWAESLGAMKLKSVVWDEAQELRRSTANNQMTAKYAGALHIRRKVERSLALTATPIYGLGSEFFNVIECVRPGSLGTRAEFLREWCLAAGRDDDAQIKDPKVFGAYLRESGLMLRRTRVEVGRELPPVQSIPQHVDADESALDQVKGACGELAKAILQKGEAYRGEKLKISGEFSDAIRQATGVAKAPYVADFVRLLVESGESVVVYLWHRAAYDIVNARLEDLKPVMYTGSETPKQKDKAKADFVAGRTKVLLISLRAGAGLDGLQHVCRTVVFGELDWAPGVHLQCAGRVARDGQKEPVAVYYLIAETGSDPIVADVLGVKRAQLVGVVDPDAELVESMEVDPDRVKRLAAHYLSAHGMSVPESVAPSEDAAVGA